MKFELVYTKQADSDLEKLGNQTAKQIIKKMRFFLLQKDPLKFASPLKGTYKGYSRFRIGNYRAIFYKDSGGNVIVLTVVSVKHRKEVYE